MTTPKGEFDVAKAIADELKALEKESQQRVLRWVAESLGLFAQPALAPQVHRQDPSASGGIPAAQPAPASGQQEAAKPADIRSFVQAKRPKSDNQFAAVVAYYYRFEAPPQDRRDTIDGELLQNAARLSGRERFANPRHTLKNAKSAGYLDNPERGQYAINSVGENLVAMTLPGGAPDQSAPANRTKRKTRGKRGAKKR